jgi:hypothetical protein
MESKQCLSFDKADSNSRDFHWRVMSQSMKRVGWVSETYKDLALRFVSLLVIYAGRPAPCSQGDAHHVQVALCYSLEPHQLPKLFSAVVVVDIDDDASNYETTT